MSFVRAGAATWLFNKIQLKNGVMYFDGAGSPKSGTSGTGMVGTHGPAFGSIYHDKTNGVDYVNESAVTTSVYWTPRSFDQPRLYGWFTNFNDGQQKALSDTAATATLSSGIRVHGNGVVETDGGLTVTMSDQGSLGVLQNSAHAAETAVLSFGLGTTPVMKPSVNGTCVVDAVVTQGAVTARSCYLGFANSAADALLQPLIGGTATITPATTLGDQFAALFTDSRLTLSTSVFAVEDKANTQASITGAAYTAADTGVDIAAATYNRFRVEIDTDGTVRYFIDKALVKTTAAAAVDPTVAMQPCFILGATTTTVAIASFKKFGAWGIRATN